MHQAALLGQAVRDSRNYGWDVEEKGMGGESCVPFVLWGVWAVILQYIIHFYETSNNLEVVFIYNFNG